MRLRRPAGTIPRAILRIESLRWSHSTRQTSGRYTSPKRQLPAAVCQFPGILCRWTLKAAVMDRHELGFRVNVTPITTGKSPKNYGSAGGFIDHGTGEKCRGAGMRDAHCTQDSGLRSLLSGDRFETMPNCDKKQDPP